MQPDSSFVQLPLHATQALPPHTHKFASPISPQSSSPDWTGVIPAIAAPPNSSLPAARNIDAANRSRERAHLLAWFVSLAIILKLASRILETSHEAPIIVEPMPRAELIILLGVLALALLLRVVDLRGLPYVLMGDESKFALEARAFNQGLLFQPFRTATDGHWGPWFMVLGLFTRVLGEMIEAIRLHADFSFSEACVIIAH